MIPDRLSELVQNKYNRLLSSLLLVMVFSSLAKKEGLVRFAIVTIIILILLILLKRFNPHKVLFYFYCFLAAALLILNGFEQFGSMDSNYSVYITADILLLLVLGIPTYLIHKDISLFRSVTSDLIKGAVSVYLLSGISWAIAYDILYRFDPQSFKGVSPENISPDLFYFSFTTLTTVGYGDISAAASFSRILANLEGVFGVMYPTIFIALLVGLYQSSSNARWHQ